MSVCVSQYAPQKCLQTHHHVSPPTFGVDILILLLYSNIYKGIGSFVLVPWMQRQCPVIKLSGPEVIKLFSCSTQLSMNFFLLIDVKMPTIVGILIFMSRKNSIIGIIWISESEKCWISGYVYTYEHKYRAPRIQVLLISILANIFFFACPRPLWCDSRY